MRRGISTALFFVAVAAALAVLAWTLGSGRGKSAQGQENLSTTRPVPAAGWGSMRVMAANIRLSEPADGDDAWTHRRETVVKNFLKYQPEVLACQEVSPAQGAYLNKELAQWYAYYPRAGVGSSSAPALGTGAELMGMLNQSLASLNTLYYRSDRFDILDGEAGLIIPDEPQAEITENTYFTLAVLQEKAGVGVGGAKSHTLIVGDSHFRHGEVFGVRCAARVREKIGRWLKKYPGAGVIVLGDMNQDRTSKLYAVLTAGGPAAGGPDALAADGCPRLADSFDYPAKPPAEKWGTFHNFTGQGFRDWPTDLIFYAGQLALAPGGAALIDRDQGPQGRWPSDHFFVTAELQWRGK